jgi:hypothetical protein
MSEQLSVRAYARRRGCSHTAVQHALRDGRIVKGDDGLIDVGQADAAWARNTSPDQGGRRQKPDPQPAPASGVSSLPVSRELKESAIAETRQVQLRVLKGELVDAAEAARSRFTTARMTRDAMLAVPTRVAAQLAATLTAAVTAELERERPKTRAAVVELVARVVGDVGRVHAVLESEILAALHQLADAIEAGAGA